MADEVSAVAFVVSTAFMSGEPKLFSSPIVRETARFYFIDRSTVTRSDHAAYSAFGYRERIPKAEVATTAEAAWRRYVENQRLIKARAEAALSVERERLVLADRQLAKFQAVTHGA